MNVPVPKIGALQRGPWTQNCNFLKTAVMILIKFQQFMETISLNEISSVISLGK
jgi:hypothetical protein